MHGFVTYGLLGTRLKQNIEKKLRGVEKALKNGRLFPKGDPRDFEFHRY